MAVLTEYIPIDWVNNTAPAINAANLNYTQQGIKAVTDKVLEHQAIIGENTTSIPKGSWTWDGTTLRITVEDV